jgi:hypothetical protein
MFLCVYLSCTVSATRMLVGPAGRRGDRRRDPLEPAADVESAAAAAFRPAAPQIVRYTLFG